VRGSTATAGLRELLEEARGSGVRQREADRTELDALARDHHGVAALVRMPDAIGERELALRGYGPDDLIVVLDGIEDPQNLGAAARSAEAAGACLLVTRTRRAAAVTPAAVRASSGALLHLPLARVANVPRALERLKGAGFFVLGLDERSPIGVFEAESPDGRVAVVVGSEGEGLSRLTRQACDLLVALPMRGRVGSLNASAALAALLYALVLPRRAADGA
jgi:23S rRNA (guanosine2251-2'-O)-methyltransferase